MLRRSADMGYAGTGTSGSRAEDIRSRRGIEDNGVMLGIKRDTGYEIIRPVRINSACDGEHGPGFTRIGQRAEI